MMEQSDMYGNPYSLNVYKSIGCKGTPIFWHQLRPLFIYVHNVEKKNMFNRKSKYRMYAIARALFI